jgi:hypothetical protein
VEPLPAADSTHISPPVTAVPHSPGEAVLLTLMIVSLPFNQIIAKNLIFNKIRISNLFHASSTYLLNSPTFDWVSRG